MSGVTATLSDSWVVARRNLIRIKRVPDMLVFSSIQPVMLVLLFAYVFGGSISLHGVGYREYLIPGIFVQTVGFTAAMTAVGLAEDVHRGLVDRFRSLPMSRAALLAGRTTSDLLNNVLVVVVMTLCGLVVGWRIHEGVGSGIAGFALLLAFGYAMSWVCSAIGLAVRTVEVAQTAVFMWMFPLTFLSNAYVSTATLPGPLRVFADWNPISSFCLALRDLWGNAALGPDRGRGFPADHPVLMSVGWILAILAVFVPLSVARYRRAGSSV